MKPKARKPAAKRVATSPAKAPRRAARGSRAASKGASTGSKKAIGGKPAAATPRRNAAPPPRAAAPRSVAPAPAPPPLRHALPAADREKFRRVLVGLRSNRSHDKESREREALKAAGQDVSVDHMADYGSDNYEQEFTLGLIETDVETLRDIDDALVKIERGGFGLCEECGEKIARARIAAIPYARLCISCKMKEE